MFESSRGKSYRRLLLAAGCVVIVSTVADAQTADADRSLIASPANATSAAYAALSVDDGAMLRNALDQGRRGQTALLDQARRSLGDPIARKIATWALIDQSPQSLSFAELDRARTELAGWPREAKRQAAAEAVLETSGLDARRIVAWFDGAEPQSAQGALALATALRATGQDKAAGDLIRRFWRDKVFEADVQRAMLSRFGGVLTQADHDRRADILLYGAQGPATRDVIALASPQTQAEAQVRMAYRAGLASANDLYAALTPDQQLAPGVALERASFMRRKGLDTAALGLVRYFAAPPTDEAAARIWTERKQLLFSAMRANNFAGAYAAAANSGLPDGGDAADAEFYAGWIALKQLNNPSLAAQHFERLNKIGTSPITRSRALYWQGRVNEALGDRITAASYYADGARLQTTFYGQLSAEKVGIRQIALGTDPVITAADRARFENYEIVRAIRLLNRIGARDTFRGFVLYADDVLPTIQDVALLTDLAKSVGDQDLTMRVVRAAAFRHMILPERGYPLMPPPANPTSAENAFVFSIARQESNFDPMAKSAPGARGMMQLMPATAQLVARKLGQPYSINMLHDAEYNVRLGSTFLGDMVDRFGGSYVMAAAAYNAGPGRPPQWVERCGDPRGTNADPLDFIECIPFSETRNYVMRTLETTQVYRARLNGGTAPLTLSSDLKRGGSMGGYASITAAAQP